MKRFRFLGELGFFAKYFIGFLEHYFKENPDEKFYIFTFSNYGKVLKLLYPNNVIIEEYKGPDLQRHRGGFDVHRLEKDMYKYIPFSTTEHAEPFFQEYVKKKQGCISYQRISSPIIYGDKFKKPVFSCLMRNRDCPLSCSNSCFNLSDSCLFNESFYDYDKYSLGKKDEITEADGFVFVEDFLQQINTLNNSLLFISSVSGYAEFASYCGVKDIALLIEPERFKENERIYIKCVSDVIINNNINCHHVYRNKDGLFDLRNIIDGILEKKGMH
jgi:hypothetical protein